MLNFSDAGEESPMEKSASLQAADVRVVGGHNGDIDEKSRLLPLPAYGGHKV